MSRTTTDTAAPELMAQQQVAWLLQQARLQAPPACSAWPWLEAAHIVGQTQFALHGRIHVHMLVQAWRERNMQEGIAQLLRLALVPVGHLLQRLPVGNPGSSRIDALTPMAVPMHLADLIEKSRSSVVTGVST